MKKCACHVLSSNTCFTVKYQDVSKHEAGQRSGILVQFLWLKSLLKQVLSGENVY